MMALTQEQRQAAARATEERVRREIAEDCRLFCIHGTVVRWDRATGLVETVGGIDFS